jgi:hypothetical protein
MRKTVLRILGLAFIVALSALPKVHAYDGECHIYCYGGGSWSVSVASLSDCCSLFGYYCGYYGEAYREEGPFGAAYCPNWGS